MRVALIADDLTGAMDAAAPFARRGAATRVLPRADRFSAERDGGFEVVAVNTESRHMDAAAAAQATRRAIEALAACGPEVVFKKIDSTLRGQVVAEIAAALGTGVRTRALIAPAVPAQGRAMRRGEVFVRGVALAQSEIARDARMPAPAVPLATLLQTAAVPPIRSAVLAREAGLSSAPDDVGAVLADCEVDADFARLFPASAAHGHWLWVGAAGLGSALAGHLWPSPLPPVPIVRRAGGAVLFLIGSRTERSAVQVQCLVDTGRAELVVAASGRVDHELVAAACRRQPGGAVILCATQGEETRDADAVARDLGQAGARSIAGGLVDAVFVTGGDTASALIAAVDVQAIDLAGEIEPGIALASIDAGRCRIPLITKSGGFGEDSVLVSVLDYLGGRR